MDFSLFNALLFPQLDILLILMLLWACKSLCILYLYGSTTVVLNIRVCDMSLCSLYDSCENVQSSITHLHHLLRSYPARLAFSRCFWVALALQKILIAKFAIPGSPKVLLEITCCLDEPVPIELVAVLSFAVPNCHLFVWGLKSLDEGCYCRKGHSKGTVHSDILSVALSYTPAFRNGERDVGVLCRKWNLREWTPEKGLWGEIMWLESFDGEV